MAALGRGFGRGGVDVLFFVLVLDPLHAKASANPLECGLAKARTQQLWR